MSTAERDELLTPGVKARAHFPFFTEGPGGCYLDSAATAQKPLVVIDSLRHTLIYHNANVHRGAYRLSAEASERYDDARAKIARYIGAGSPRSIVFVRGATEAINLVARSSEHLFKEGDTILLTLLEHHSNIVPWQMLAKRKKLSIVFAGIQPDGSLDVGDFNEKVKHYKPALVAVTQLANSLGTVTPIAELVATAQKQGARVLVDGAQGAPHLGVNVTDLGCDYYVFSGHKMYGPKGVGALYVRRRNPRVQISAQMDGGGHERGMRSGTLNVPGIVGFGKAAALCQELMPVEDEKHRVMRDRLKAKLESSLEETYINGSMTSRLPHNLNMSFAYVEGESLLMGINDIAVSSGSACTSATLEPSYVLKALGLGDDLAHTSIRFGIGRFNTDEEVDYVANKMIEVVNKLRELSPLWEMFKDGVDLSKVEWTAH